MRTDALQIATVALAIVLVMLPGARAQDRPAITGGETVHTVVAGDTLRGLSSRYGVDSRVIAAANDLKANAILRAGQTLRIDNRHIVPGAEPGTIVVNVPQRMLFYSDAAGVVAVPVAVGQPGWQTPTKPFTVVSKETDPTWDVPVSIQEEARLAGKSLPAVVPPGPANPLGRFWLGLSIPSVGIHSTNAPSSIYRVATHGCIRVGPDDMAWLFPRVPVGTRGVVVYEPVLLALVDDDVFLEVHPDAYRRLSVDPLIVVRTRAEAAGIEHAIDWAMAERVLRARHGVATSVGLRGQARASD